jgi:hypothetical protein
MSSVRHENRSVDIGELDAAAIVIFFTISILSIGTARDESNEA